MTMVSRDDRLNNSKSEAGTAFFVGDKGFKNVGLLFRGHTCSVITDRKNDMCAVERGRKCDMAARAGGFRGIF